MMWSLWIVQLTALSWIGGQLSLALFTLRRGKDVQQTVQEWLTQAFNYITHIQITRRQTLHQWGHRPLFVWGLMRVLINVLSYYNDLMSRTMWESPRSCAPCTCATFPFNQPKKIWRFNYQKMQSASCPRQWMAHRAHWGYQEGTSGQLGHWFELFDRTGGANRVQKSQVDLRSLSQNLLERAVISDYRA